jgi:hypothetical protein
MTGKRIFISIQGITFIIGLFVFSGCGYTSRSMISGQYRTIYIPAFVNKIDITRPTDTESKYKIYRPFIETDVTKGVNNYFLWDGNLRPVKSNDADLTLKGEVVEFRKDPIKYNQSYDVSEYQMNIIVDLVLTDNKTKKVVWEEKGFAGWTNYYTSSAPAPAVPKTESQAVTDTVTDLSRRIVERTVEQW